jgi:hypothetical protein
MLPLKIRMSAARITSAESRDTYVLRDTPNKCRSRRHHRPSSTQTPVTPSYLALTEGILIGEAGKLLLKLVAPNSGSVLQQLLRPSTVARLAVYGVASPSSSRRKKFQFRLPFSAHH